MQLRTVLGEAAKDNAGDSRRRFQRADDGGDRDGRGTIGRETIDAGGDRGKGDRGKAVGLTQLDRAAIAGGQCGVFTLAAAVPYRSDCMNDMPRPQAVTFGNLGIAGGAAAKRAAFGEQLRPRRAMDRAIDAAAAQQRRVRGVDDSVNA
jgi:hypothetical protein